MEKVKKPLAVAADAAYKTPAITKFLFENDIHTGTSIYTSENKRRILCVNMSTCMMSTMIAIFVRKDKFLSYATTTKEGKRQYKSDPTQVCKVSFISTMYRE